MSNKKVELKTFVDGHPNSTFELTPQEYETLRKKYREALKFYFELGDYTEEERDLLIDFAEKM